MNLAWNTVGGLGQGSSPGLVILRALTGTSWGQSKETIVTTYKLLISSTPMSKIWKSIRKLNRKYPNSQPPSNNVFLPLKGREERKNFFATRQHINYNDPVKYKHHNIIFHMYLLFCIRPLNIFGWIQFYGIFHSRFSSTATVTEWGCYAHTTVLHYKLRNHPAVFPLPAFHYNKFTELYHNELCRHNWRAELRFPIGNRFPSVHLWLRTYGRQSLLWVNPRYSMNA